MNHSTIESERKFVLDDLPKGLGSPLRIEQHYLVKGAVEVRARNKGGRYTLTVKAGGPARDRTEVEAALSRAEFEALVVAAGSSICKDRYEVSQGVTVDVFDEATLGRPLILLEVEAPAEVPSWAGQEVTGDPGYYNATLAKP